MANWRFYKECNRAESQLYQEDGLGRRIDEISSADGRFPRFYIYIERKGASEDQAISWNPLALLTHRL